MRVWLTAVAFICGCSEYTITEAPDAFGEPNPAALDNPEKEDVLVQLTMPAVDILWVVDNSSSMADNQDALATNFPLFMDYFLGSGLDYHIGVVSTDTDDPNHSGKLNEVDGLKWIDIDTPDPANTFARMARIGINGSSNERGREGAYLAFTEAASYNAGFVRKDDDTAGIHVTVISDTDDGSRDSVISINEYVDFLNGLRPTDEQVTFNSICNPPGQGGFNRDGLDYIAVTNGVGGLMRDIESNSWAEILDALGLQAAGLRTEYFLSSLPVADTIEVWVEEGGETFPFERDVDYEYVEGRNSIVFFAYVPNPLAKVVIHYTQLASVLD